MASYAFTAQAGARQCVQCGKAFHAAKPSRKQRETGHIQQFCSNTCRAQSQAMQAHPTCDVDLVQCVVCAAPFVRRVANKLCCSETCQRQRALDAAKPVRRGIFACQECGAEFTPAYGDKRRAHCSDICARRHGGRIERKMARAARHGITLIERVDPLVIFERDRWTCQSCGIDTPRELTGSGADNSPEMDHIIALSRGGSHTTSNVQCLCRRCNRDKARTVDCQPIAA